MKRCGSCRRLLPEEAFDRHSRKGRQHWCKECMKQYRLRWEMSPSARLSKRRRRMKSSYGISLAEYEAMFIEQDGRCAICRTERNAWQSTGQAGRFDILY